MTLRAQWLGQAGFLVEHEGPDTVNANVERLLIDPYLSDSLARKYAGRPFAHERMAETPLAAADVPAVSGVLCTHAHTDHMDPDTLIPLLASHPGVPLVCPAAVAGEALRRGAIGPDRLRGLVDGDRTNLGGFTVDAVPSAHERREHDGLGRDRFLGYVVRHGGTTFYHSGDCAPWDGLAVRLASFCVDVALLPVNGRDAYRLGNGVPGNFTFTEAVALCEAAGIGRLVPHHWGMFSFNTADPATFDLDAAARHGVEVSVPRIGQWLTLDEVSA